MIKIWLLLLPAFAAVTVPAAGMQIPTFSVMTEEVQLDVLVLDKDKKAGELQAGDFEVLENGVPQVIQQATLQKKTPVSVTLVFDVSRSVYGDLLVHLKEAVDTFLSSLNKDDHAALITFNHAVVLASPRSNEFSRIRQALDNVTPFGHSSLVDAVHTALLFAESKDDAPLLIVFSDGLDNYSLLSEKTVLDTAKRVNAAVYAVSVHSRQKNVFLKDIAQLTGGSLFEVGSPQGLSNAFLSILNEYRQRYQLIYTPKGALQSDWHAVSVRVKNKPVKVRTRPGYMRKASGMESAQQAEP